MINGKLNVLIAASEGAPLCKTGGLADVVGALPKALAKLSVNTSTILPFYRTLPKSVRKKASLIAHYTVNIGEKKQYAGLMKTVFQGRTYYFIDNEEYFDRDNLYGYFEDGERFIFFSLAVVKALKYIEGVDIIHCNDWQTALIPLAVSKLCYDADYCKDMKTVYTIHNLRFQGKLGISDFISMLRLNGGEDWLHEANHYWRANLMKAALYSSDVVTTVSKTYADEIKCEYFGETLDGCIHDIEHKLHGILNGLDINEFNPTEDGAIYQQYNSLTGKKENKRQFVQEYNLDNEDYMLIGMVTRLDVQKGLDLVLHAIDKIMQLPVNFVLLGTGDGEYEQAFREIEAKYKGRVRSFIMYNDTFARKIYASSDVFLMPSKFEPCGLGQMIAMRYGTLPLVRETGGLSDTVTPYNEIMGEGTGFSFANYNGDELLETVTRAYNVYSTNKEDFDTMARRAMKQDFSWNKSAKEYKKLYMSLVDMD